MDFCHSHEIYPTNTEKRIGYCRKNRTRCFQKTSPQNREFIGNKNTEKIMKPKPMPDMNSKNIEEIVIPPEKR